MKSVTPKMADDCLKAYAAIEKRFNAKPTTGVGFNARELSDWLKKVSPFAKEIQVRFGIYTDQHAPNPKDAGRITVFFYACDGNGDTAKDDDGEEIPPVNTGFPYP